MIVRELARRSALGDTDADSILDSLSRKVGRCLGVPCVVRHAGTVDGPGDTFVSRTFCWCCARLEYYGDLENTKLLRKAKKIWKESDLDLPALALSMEPIPRRYRFKNDQGEFRG